MQSVTKKMGVQLKKPAAMDKNCHVTMCNKKQVPLYKDNSCKSTRIYRRSVCSDKNCQENENIDMQPVKPQMNVQLKKPAMKSSNKKLIESNKNCEATISCKKQKECEYDDSKSHMSRNSDKNYQGKINNNMWSVINTKHMQLPKPARLCSDKNCQSTRCYKSPVGPMNKYDKNCQL